MLSPSDSDVEDSVFQTVPFVRSFVHSSVHPIRYCYHDLMNGLNYFFCIKLTENIH